MIEVEIQIPAIINSNIMIGYVEQVCTDNHLILTLKGTLAMYPGYVHWHFKKKRQTGTIEITWWEKERRLWLKIGDHRSAAWIGKIIPHLKKQLETSFS